jgi:hypothetical protein
MNKKIVSSIIISLFAVGSMSAFAMTKAEHSSAKTQISADYKSAKAGCSSMSGNAKDICMAEAKGAEKVAKADLEARYTGKEKHQYDLRMAKAEAAYSIAKEKCDDRAGNDKDVCMKEAKAAEVKAKADAKMTKTVKNATTDSMDDRMTADYKVAVEKCDALSGDAKTACVNSAKTKFNKG